MSDEEFPPPHRGQGDAASPYGSPPSAWPIDQSDRSLPSPYAAGPPLGNAQPVQGYGYPYPGPTQPARSGLYLAAAIVNWVVLGLLILGTCGIGIIAAAWFVPMTIYIHKGVTDGRRHTALGVCTLIFCNLISGILMLVDDSNRPQV